MRDNATQYEQAFLTWDGRKIGSLGRALNGSLPGGQARALALVTSQPDRQPVVEAESEVPFVSGGYDASTSGTATLARQAVVGSLAGNRHGHTLTFTLWRGTHASMELECSIWWRDFTSPPSTREPKLLSCGHMFCCGCLGESTD